MARVNYKGFPTDSAGNRLVGIDIRVNFQTGGSPANVYAAQTGGSPITQPFQTGSDGSFEFWAEPQNYTILAGVGASQQSLPITLQNFGTVEFSDGTAALPSITNAGDTNTGLYFPAADTLAVTIGGTEAVRINSSRQLSVLDGTAALPSITNIGDTNTGLYFPAADTVGVSTNGTLRWQVNASGQSEFPDGSNTLPSITNIGDTNTGLYFPAADTVGVTIGGTDAIRVNSSRQVGIGITSPDGTLHVHTATSGSVTAHADADDLVVENNTSGGISILTPNTVTGSIYFGDSDNNRIGGIQYTHASNIMLFRVSDAERARINGAGGFKASTNGTYVAPTSAIHEMYNGDNQPTLLLSAVNAGFTDHNIQIRTSRAGASSYSFGEWFSNGSSDREFRFSGDGNGFCDGSWTGGGADFAEYFEWVDGNPDNEDRAGFTVVLENGKVRKADDDETPIGAVSTVAAVVGDGDVSGWKGKYLKDDFGRYVMEPYTHVSWHEDGDGHYHSYQADRVPDEIVVPENAIKVSKDKNGEKLMRRKLNPDYVEGTEYISRQDRPEWELIGLVGKIRIFKGQSVDPRWIKMRNISNTVEEWLIR